MYRILTTYEGLYIFYAVPIVFFIIIVRRIISSFRSSGKRIGIGEVMAVAALGLLTLDFIYYLYLFFTKTGELLPPLHLLLKYTGGFLLWLWIVWHSYKKYFSRRVAGEQFMARWKQVIWVAVGSGVLAIIGIMIS